MGLEIEMYFAKLMLVGLFNLEFNVWLTLVGIIVSIVGVIYTKKAVGVAYDIYVKQKNDSDTQINLERYRKNPYFNIELLGRVSYNLEGENINSEIDRYILPVEKYFEKTLTEMVFTIDNIGFNWAKVLGVKYKVEIIQENIDKFNDSFRNTVGEDIVSIKQDGTVIMSIGNKKTIFFSGIKKGSLGLYKDSSRGKGQTYNLELGKGLIDVLILEEKIAKLHECGVDTGSFKGFRPDLFTIKLEVEYINSGTDDNSVISDTYIGMRKSNGSVRSINNTYFEYMYRYIFEREDKYNDLLKYNEKNYKRELEYKKEREKEKIEYQKLGN